MKVDGSDVVWKEFCEFIGRHIGPDQKGVLVAWNGQSCDLRWIYKFFQAPRSVLSLTVNLIFFMDPSIVIKHYAWCKLHANAQVILYESFVNLIFYLCSASNLISYIFKTECIARTRLTRYGGFVRLNVLQEPNHFNLLSSTHFSLFTTFLYYYYVDIRQLTYHK